MASTGWDGALKVWELATGDERIAHRFDGIAMDVAFSPDGKALSASSMDRTAWLGDAAGETLGSDVATVRARLEALTTAAIDEGGVPATARP
jgi:WD40 repeat protein